MRICCLSLITLMLVILTGCTPDNNTSRQAAKSIPFDFPDLKTPVFRDQTFDIREYGAKSGDTTFLNTQSISKAIDECHRAGGGTVLVPSGWWLTGPVHLKSHVNLHLEEGAELRFSKNFSDYLPVVLQRRGGMFCYNYSPGLYARNCENIAVTGAGILNGQGEVWWPWKKNQAGYEQLIRMSKSGVPVEERIFGTEEAGIRPSFIQFIECKNVLLEGVTVKDGFSWNVNPVFCENVIIRKIKVDALGPNNDGINPDGCKNVLIEDCLLNTGDNAITFKSGRDEEAREMGHALENVVARRCTVLTGGGIAVGSEMSAGVRNILVEDCYLTGSGLGLGFKSRLGRGGVVENFWARNITMENIKKYAIGMTLQYIDRSVGDQEIKPAESEMVNAPVFRNLNFENIICRGAGTAITIQGLPGNYLYDLDFKNITISSDKGLIISDVQDVSFENVKITPREDKVTPP